MLEVMQQADNILARSRRLEELLGELDLAGGKKADAITTYDKMLAITLIRLRNGEEIKFEGEVVISPPATIMEKIAKGICQHQRFDVEIAETGYKSLITKIEGLKASMYAHQSVFKHLDVT